MSPTSWTWCFVLVLQLTHWCLIPDSFNKTSLIISTSSKGIKFKLNIFLSTMMTLFLLRSKMTTVHHIEMKFLIEFNGFSLKWFKFTQEYSNTRLIERLNSSYKGPTLLQWIMTQKVRTRLIHPNIGMSKSPLFNNWFLMPRMVWLSTKHLVTV